MSELLVQPVEIQAIKPHPNADKLEIAVIGGWELITGIGNYSVGDVVIHIPPEAMVPVEWAKRWDVTQYLSWRNEATHGRVRAARLRGIVSYGFLVPNDSNAPLGTDLAEHYDIHKYEPPESHGAQAGRVSNEHPLFHRYTDIQNIRNYPNKIDWEHTLVAVTEKIHGTNSRVGWVKRLNDNISGINMAEHFEAWRDSEYELVVGSHRTQRDIDDCGVYGLPLEKHKEGLDKLFDWVINTAANGLGSINSVIVFGEIYGAGVQDLHYGQKTEKAWRIFDIAINGEYMGYMALRDICEMCDLPTVPQIGIGMYDLAQVLELADGDTTLDDQHIREGVVVRPAVFEGIWKKGEKDPNPKRLIFKAIGGNYLSRKGGTEHH